MLGGATYKVSRLICSAIAVITCVLAYTAIAGAAAGAEKSVGASNAAKSFPATFNPSVVAGAASASRKDGRLSSHRLPRIVHLPAIRGRAVQGSTLHTTAGAWSGQPSHYRYGWYDCDAHGESCRLISDAHTSAYKVLSRDLRHTIRSYVIAGQGAVATSASSRATKTVTAAAPGNTAAPSITGTAQVGTRLVVSTGTWSNSPTRFTYAWQRCVQNACTQISGATSSTYRVTATDVSTQLEATVTAANSHGTGTPIASDATATVTPQPPVDKSAPKISGTARQGSVLTATAGTWTGSPTSYSYEWEDCSAGSGSSVLSSSCVAIADADTSQYSPTAGDVGLHLRVLVSATNAGGPSLAATASSLTTAVTSIPPAATPSPVNSASPAITGTAQQSDTLTTTTGSWSGSPTSYSYQWQDCDASGSGCTAISGATSPTYVPEASDVGNTLTVIVTATNVGGSSSASAPVSTVVTPLSPAASVVPTITGTMQQGNTLTASTGAWTSNPSAYSYQWEDCDASGTSCSSISNATGATYTTQSSDVGRTMAVTVTATNPGGSGSATSSPTTVVEPLFPVDVLPPTIIGAAQQGDTLTASTGTWTGDPTGYSYQWQDCAAGIPGTGLGSTCVNIAGATGPQYILTAGDVGQLVQVLVSASNGGGQSLLAAASPLTAAVTAATPPPPPPPAPVNTSAPAVSGTDQQGYTLSVEAGTWTGSPTAYSYQWKDCNTAGNSCTTISGATSASYALQPSDVGHTLTVLVTATNAGASTEASSAATVAIEPLAPTDTVLPTITGTAQQGGTLTAGSGTWTGSPTGYSYMWQQCDTSGTDCATISGAISATYTPAGGDVGHTLTVVVTAVNAGGSSSATSVATAVVIPPAPVNTSVPVVSGSTQQGSTLTATTGSWTASPTSYSYQWQDCNTSGAGCSVISGATASTYTLQSADAGHTLTVVVKATNAGGTASATSAATAVVTPSAPVETAAPTISGSALQGSTLTAGAGTWTGSPTSYAYQWQDCNSTGTSCTAISGATASTYVLQSADNGHTVVVTVTATNAGGSDSATSAATSVVEPPKPTNTKLPAITGTTRQGSTLTAAAGTWTGSPTSYAYQWQDCNSTGTSCTAISGATSATYTLTAGDVSKTITVVVTATNAGGNATATSAATAVVTPLAPTNTATPTITGTAQQGSTLTAGAGTWTGSPTSYTYQWQDCNGSGTSCSSITGATSSSYVPQSTDVGDELGVVVTATNAGGSTNAMSPTTTAVTAAAAGGSATCTSPCSTAPAVTGSARVGQTLSVSEGKWSNTVNAYSYQWEDCSGSSCSPVSGGISTPQCSGTSSSCPSVVEKNFQTYIVQPSDEGYTLKVVVTAENGSSYTATTAPTAVVPSGAPSNSAAPSVSGTAAIGNVLTATQGTWSGSGNTYTYQWNDCLEEDILPSGCEPISDATSPLYTIKNADGGFKLDVTVTATNSNGSQSVSSNETASYVPVPPAAIGTPTVAGQAVLGTTLTAMYHFSGSVPSYAFQWQRCDANGNSCAAISGATSQTYTVDAADEGSTLRVTVTASNDGGAQTASSTSAATPLIQIPTGSGIPASTQAPVISGSIGYGGTVTTSVGLWSGTPSSYTYQWQDCNGSGSSCSNVSAGGTAYAYTISATDIGQYLRVEVTASNGSGSSTAVSAVTTNIQSPSSVVSGVQPSGLTIVGDKFENDEGQPVTFHGEDLSGTDTACGNDGVFSDNMPATNATAAALAPWNSNGITLGTNEDCWLGINGTSPTGTAYQSDLSSFVNVLNNYGQYVMLSAKATAPGSIEAGPNAGEANAPDEDHSPWYWAGLASAYRNNPNIIDAVWSELASTSVYWNCYESTECGATASAGGNGPYDGGAVCGNGAWACYYYTEATMQQAVDITRAFGYNGPISIPCIGYAVWCGDATTGGSSYGGSWVLSRPTDPDNQMTAEAHWYENDACDTNACHDVQLQTINNAGYPLILGESGESGDNNAAPSCGAWSGTYNPPTTYGTYSPSYQGTEGWLPDLYNKGLSGWFAYAFNDFNTAGVLIANGTGTPYQSGAEPASGWYSDCMQTLDRSLPG